MQIELAFLNELAGWMLVVTGTGGPLMEAFNAFNSALNSSLISAAMSPTRPENWFGCCEFSLEFC